MASSVSVRFLIVLAVAAAPFTACSDDGDDGPGTDPSESGAIAGSVTADGAGIAGASIALSGAGTGATTTDADGDYRFDDLDPGSYTVTLTVPDGYELAAGQTAARAATVTDGGTATVNWTLVETGGGGTVVTVTASGTSFSPATITISPGTTVRWVAADGAHTVTPDDPGQTGAWTSADLVPGSPFEHTFTAAGTFDYHCVPHEAFGMTGQVVVQ